MSNFNKGEFISFNSLKQQFDTKIGNVLTSALCFNRESENANVNYGHIYMVNRKRLLCLRGGGEDTTAFDSDGASLKLYGAEYDNTSGLSGCIKLTAQIDSKQSELKLDPEGTLSFTNIKFYKDGYIGFSKTGGGLRTHPTIDTQTNTTTHNKYISMYGGEGYYDGGGVVCYGKDYNVNNNEGSVRISTSTSDGVNKFSYVFRPTGVVCKIEKEDDDTFTYKHFVTTVNDKSASEQGNVVVDKLPSTTVNGWLKLCRSEVNYLYGGHIYMSDNKNYMIIDGGDGQRYSNGGRLYLYGNECTIKSENDDGSISETPSNLAGGFSLSAHNGEEENSVLRGYTDGRLTWLEAGESSSKNIVRSVNNKTADVHGNVNISAPMYPNYSNFSLVSSINATTYTGKTTSDGWLYFIVTGYDNYTTLKIGGFTLINNVKVSEHMMANLFYPVKSETSYTITVSDNASIYFLPNV